MPEKSPSIDKLRTSNQEQEGQVLESAIKMARRSHLEIEPHNLSPEAVEALTAIMNEAIEAYEKYKTSNDIKDGQDALLLLEKYRDEFVRYKEQKRELLNVEFVEIPLDADYRVDISQYEGIRDPKIVGNRLLFRARIGEKDYLVDGNNFSLGDKYEYISSPHEYNGRLVFMGIKDEEGAELSLFDEDEVEIVTKLSPYNDKILEMNGKLLFFTMKNSGGNTIRDIENKIYNTGVDNVGNFFVVDGELVMKSQFNTESHLVNKDGNRLTMNYPILTDVAKEGDSLIFVSSDNDGSWELREGLDEEVLISERDEIKTPAIIGGEVVYSIGGAVYIFDGSDSFEIFSNYDEIYDIQKIDEESGYFLARKGDELIKKVFKVE